MIAVRVLILQYVDDAQPGWVECLLTDVHGRAWSFVEKVPVVTGEDLDADSAYPRGSVIACRIIERRRAVGGQEVITIDTSLPWHVAATSGETRFEVSAEQLSTIDSG